jgi:hypothetical protein
MPGEHHRTVSVSTKFATLPSSSSRLELSLVPARMGKRGKAGIVRVPANPRITEVRMRDESRFLLNRLGPKS